MKRILLLLLVIASTSAFAQTMHNIAIVGNTYSPSQIDAIVGDSVTIQASPSHPLVEVDLTTWENNGNTPLPGGWGTKTSDYKFKITQMGNIHFVCSQHVSMGMKGRIIVANPSAVATIEANRAPALFPNPVSDGGITITNAYAKSSLVIYNTNGQLAEKHDIDGPLTRVATYLAAGLYLYTINDENQAILSRGKLVITR